MTALTTVPFLVWPSGAASFTLAVMTSPSPALRPVEPPSGRIICSLRAPELSATSSIDLIITAIVPDLPQRASLSRAPPRTGSSQRLTDCRRRNFRHQRSPAHNLLQPPALQHGQRTSLFQPDHIAHVSFVFLVMGVELLGFRDHSSVAGMRLLAHHLHHDGLVHAARNPLADHFLASPRRLLQRRPALRFRLGHHFFSVPPAAVSSRSRAMVLTRAMSLRRPRIFFRLSVCPMLS